MKNAFRLLLSTVTAAAVLLLLFRTRDFYLQESTLGDTVDNIVLRCLQLLKGMTVVLYLRCWLSLLVQAIRRSVHRRNGSVTKEKTR